MQLSSAPAIRVLQRLSLVNVHYVGGIGIPAKATVSVNVDGRIHQGIDEGKGPVDAVWKVLKELLHVDAELNDYQVHGANPGSDVSAIVEVEVAIMGRSVRVHGKDTDTVVASARAFVEAFNEHYR